MDLSLSPSEEAFRQEFDAWLGANLPPELASTRVRALGDDDALAARKAGSVLRPGRQLTVARSAAVVPARI